MTNYWDLCMHAYEMHPRKTHAHEMNAQDMHAHDMYTCEMHACEVYAVRYTSMRHTPMRYMPLRCTSERVWRRSPDLPSYKRWCGSRFVEIWVAKCCAQQTGVHRMVGSNCLAVYLPKKERTFTYVRSTLTPRHFAALPSGACPADPSAASV
jgi:hypothetical protein